MRISIFAMLIVSITLGCKSRSPSESEPLAVTQQRMDSTYPRKVLTVNKVLKSGFVNQFFEQQTNRTLCFGQAVDNGTDYVIWSAVSDGRQYQEECVTGEQNVIELRRVQTFFVTQDGLKIGDGSPDQLNSVCSGIFVHECSIGVDEYGTISIRTPIPSDTLSDTQPFESTYNQQLVNVARVLRSEFANRLFEKQTNKILCFGQVYDNDTAYVIWAAISDGRQYQEECVPGAQSVIELRRFDSKFKTRDGLEVADGGYDYLSSICKNGRVCDVGLDAVGNISIRAK